MQLHGIHHLTAVSSDARGNHDFYTRVLGMRLVKKTVNQDDVSAYHLFYGDAVASPGADLTFFDWPAAPNKRGNHEVGRTGLRVASEADLGWWKEHLAEHDVASGNIKERAGHLSLDFEDFEGQRFRLIADPKAGPGHPWDKSPIPAEHQIRGLGPILLSVPDLGPTDALLQRALGMRPIRDYPHPDNQKHTVHVYEMGPGGTAAELHVAVQPELRAARQGAGGVHHVAFRTPTFEEHARWVERISQLGIRNSGLVDRYYFRSLYFREPNGILFEIASDVPGFAVDEDEATLGEKIVLPPFLEPRRAEIVANLEPIG